MNSARIKNVAVVSVLTLLGPCAFALNPSLDVSQYAHNAWTIRDGFFKGVINSIAQTPDGYLWLATEFGLLRFDGLRAVEWTPPGHERLPSTLVSSLLVTSDGAFWMGTSGGLASWNGARLTRYPELDGREVSSLVEDRDGTVWAGSLGVPTGPLCAIKRRNRMLRGGWFDRPDGSVSVPGPRRQSMGGRGDRTLALETWPAKALSDAASGTQ